MPLTDAGKLSYVLFQFAPWIGYSPNGLKYLASLPQRLPGWRVAVEFRNPSWIPQRTDEVLRFLADHGLIYVALDCPWQPFIPVATTDWVVLRFHGRNVRGWEAQQQGKQPTVAEKYDYLYSPEELAGLAQTTQRFHGKLRRVYIKFNNNNRDYPVRNALAFRKLLGQAAPDPEALKAEYQPPSRRAASRRPPRLPSLFDDRPR